MNTHYGTISRHSDQSVLIAFPSCRTASAFERDFVAAHSVLHAPKDSELTATHWLATASAELDGVETDDSNNCLKAAKAALSSAQAAVAQLQVKHDQFKAAYMAWSDKMEWMAPAQTKELGMHRADAAHQRFKELEALSVTNILLDVVSGVDGMGHEVYAKSVSDVVGVMSSLGDEVERLHAAWPRDLEARQWRNIKKVAKALADLCFGSPNDPQYGIMHTVLTTSLTAKDGLSVSALGLEPLTPTMVDATIVHKHSYPLAPGSLHLLRKVARECNAVQTDKGFEFDQPALSKLTNHLVEADRWRALLACGRIRIIGTAGVHGSGIHDPNRLNPNTTPYGNYVNFGAEFWSTFPENVYYTPKDRDYAKATLIEFADATRKALAEPSV